MRWFPSVLAMLVVLPVAVLASCGGDTPAAHVASPIVVAQVPPLEAGPESHDGSSAEAAVLTERATLPFELLMARIQALLSAPDVDVAAAEKAFHELHLLGDRRSADALARLVGTDSTLTPRWKTQAAFILAELGDARAVPLLVRRLGMHSRDLYAGEKDPRIQRAEWERYSAIMLLADLVAVNPDRREEITRAAEDTVIAWTESRTPHDEYGMHALARMATPRGRAKLRAWADPAAPLPRKGGQEDAPIPPEFETARWALRYLGLAEHLAGTPDESVFALLQKQLSRRKGSSDTSQRSALSSSLGALESGAAWGLSELSDPRAFAPLLRVAEDDRYGEASRGAACEALGWVATEADLQTIARKVSDPARRSSARGMTRECLLDAFEHRPRNPAAMALLPLISKRSTPEVRVAAGLAIGIGWTEPAEQSLITRLLSMLDDPELRAAAATALILGAPPDAAARGQASLATHPSRLVSDATERTFAFVSMRDLEEGHLARRVMNVRACGGYPLTAAQNFMRWRDRGSPIQAPHTVTYGMIRGWVEAHANDPEPKRRADARLLLETMGAASAANDSP